MKLVSGEVASDDALLDRTQRAAFGYFLEHYNPANGLVADTESEGAPASIAVVGFALASYVVGVERGWISRQDAVKRTLSALRFFAGSEHSRHAEATGHKGFYYHFLDMGSGRRAARSELSTVDTALLVAGVLTARGYFASDTPEEAEIRECAEAIFNRIDWLWCCNDEPKVRQGWKPKSGFSRHRWEGYSEAAILFFLGMGSPTHPLPAESFATWTEIYQWKTLYGQKLLYSGPLFTHQYSHAWIDFRGVQDKFMRERDCDYFENSRRATIVQREYALANPRGFKGYGENCWGFSAGEGPGKTVLMVDGVRRRFLAYAARGVPFGPEDGTIAAASAVSSLPFAPELAIPVLRHLIANSLGVTRYGRLTSGFNPTFPSAGSAGWVSSGSVGLDQGILVLMIENYRSGLIWAIMRACPYLQHGLRRAGFCGGWLGDTLS